MGFGVEFDGDRRAKQQTVEGNSPSGTHGLQKCPQKGCCRNRIENRVGTVQTSAGTAIASRDRDQTTTG